MMIAHHILTQTPGPRGKVQGARIDRASALVEAIRLADASPPERKEKVPSSATVKDFETPLKVNPALLFMSNIIKVAHLSLNWNFFQL